MKILVLTVSLLFSSFTYAAQDKPTCDELGSDEYKELNLQVVTYFFDQIATRKAAVVSLSSLQYQQIDCHDYDGELSNMEFELVWTQEAIVDGKEVTQQCTESVGVYYDAIVHVSDDEECEVIKD